MNLQTLNAFVQVGSLRDAFRFMSVLTAKKDITRLNHWKLSKAVGAEK
jgi:hypothetical protein